MMICIIKTVICSAFFLGIYYLLLEKAKMPRFNRVYLLLTPVASFVIPLIRFTTDVTVLPVLRQSDAQELLADQFFIMQDTTPLSVDVTSLILPAIWVLITGFFLTRFTINIVRLSSMAKKTNTVAFDDHKLVLLEKQVIPFSFFSYVFVNREEYETGCLEEEVLHHELEHVRQRHSVDIVFIELLKAIAWFNPLLIFYRKAIQLNHEFLADNAVVSRFNDPFAYQVLLLNKVSQASDLYAVSSQFSYKITKKRLAMITNPFNRRTNLVRALTIIPATAVAVFLFSGKITAQVDAAKTAVASPVSTSTSSQTVSAYADTTKKPAFVFPYYGGTKEGVSAALIKEYQDLVAKVSQFGKEGHRGRLSPTDNERARMREIFSKMNHEQQSQQDAAFLQPLKPLQKATPSERLMSLFADETKYGIWIDLKRVSNESLRDYKNTDFSQATVSKLYGDAKKGRSYTHQVDLMTNKSFNENNARILADKEPRLVVVMRREN